MKANGKILHALQRADDPVARKARELLDARELDPDTRARLAQARRAALHAHTDERPEGNRFWRPLPAMAGGLALAASLAVLVWTGVWQQTPSESVVNDLELLTSEEQLEFYEDLDFAAWLAEEPSPDQSQGPGIVDAG